MKQFKRYIILYEGEIYRDEVYKTKAVAKIMAKEYLEDYKIIKVEIYEKNKKML